MDFSPDGISFSKDDICKDVGGQLGDLQRGMNRIFDKGDNLFNRGVKDALDNVLPGDDDIDLSEIDDTINSAGDGFDGLKDKLGEQGIVGSDVQNIIECLAGLDGVSDLFDNFNPANMLDGVIDTSLIGKVLEGAADWLMDNAGKAINSLLNPTEQLLNNAISALQDLLDINMLDKLLQLLQCVENCPGAEGFNGSSEPINQYEIFCLTEKKKLTVFSKEEPKANGCPNNHFIDMNQTKLIQKDVPPSVLLEDKLSKVGLTINGEIDWESDVLKDNPSATVMKDKMNKISDFKKGVGDKLYSAKEFSPIPDPPEIPSIPKIENPLNNLSISKKIDALF